MISNAETGVLGELREALSVVKIPVADDSLFGERDELGILICELGVLFSAQYIAMFMEDFQNLDDVFADQAQDEGNDPRLFSTQQLDQVSLSHVAVIVPRVEAIRNQWQRSSESLSTCNCRIVNAFRKVERFTIEVDMESESRWDSRGTHELNRLERLLAQVLRKGEYQLLR